MRQDLWRLVGREVAAYARTLARRPARAPRRPRPPVPADAPTILFLHGHGDDPGAFVPLEAALAASGFSRFAAWSYRPRGTVAGVAADLARWIDTELPEGRLVVVGHSLGGILARLWLQEHGGCVRADALVTLSTPHRGLGFLPGVRFVPLARELAPPSPLLDRLEAGVHRLAALRCLSIVSRWDHFIRPPTNAAFPYARLEVVEDAGHVGVLSSPSVHRLVVSAVAPKHGAGEPSPAAP